MKKILLIGGNGYIGNRLYKDHSSNYEITSIDDCWFDNPLIPTTVQADFNDMPEEFYSKFDVIVLLAAHSSVKMCEGPLLSAYDNNIRNFVKLASKLKSHQKFIYASSSSVYGDVGEKIVNEEYNGFVPHNHYDITKHVIDLYAPKFDVQYYGLRFGTVNGYSPIVRNDIMINSMVYNAIENSEIKLYVKDIIRPILGISDLSRAIKYIIDAEEDHRGIYNLASFNSTAEQIAYGVSSIVNIPVHEYSTDPTNIDNSKLQTKCYNFSIDCNKFISTFNFEFKETIESITKELVDNFDNIIFTTRNQFKNYE
jgi:nucleoside-diphosphate-sugar epimerase